MSTSPVLHFGPFVLDPRNACLWQGAQALTLWPKDFAVLHYLVTHAERLVTKDELLAAVWPETFVSDGVLKGCIRRIRRVLRDDPRAPQVIQTVHRRGYRCIAALTEAQAPEPALDAPRRRAGATGPPRWTAAPAPDLVVGREIELAHLHEWLEQACGGKRQMIFITGEAGIGKTTVVDAFVAGIAAREHLGIAYGQCVEHYGSGEAYQSVLEALGRWCRGPRGERRRVLLRQHAPTWLAQMPGLLSTADAEVLQRLLTGTTQQRMLRELAEALEIVTADTPLVLVLEDLHWSDYGTLDLLAVLARRREPARLLVLGTYRPTDVLVQGHPLATVVQELRLHGQCMALPLGLLSEAAVGVYLAARFPEQRLPAGLASWLYRRTEGNPFFLVNMIEQAVEQGRMHAGAGAWEGPAAGADGVGDMPETLRQLIEQQLAQLGDEAQRVLAAGSVAGLAFTATAVAAGLAADIAQVEEWCEGMERRGHFLRRQGSDAWPDGTVTAQYGFAHTLYREVLYSRLPPVQRQRLHQRIAARLETGYGARAHEIAAALAVHWERGRDHARAVQYRRQAADNALRRHAHREAIHHLTVGLALLQSLPGTPARTRQELVVQTGLGPALMMAHGFAAPAVGHAYGRARTLCQQVGTTPDLFPVLWGLFAFYLVRAEFRIAQELAEQCLRLAQQVHDPALLVEAHYAQGALLHLLGVLVEARMHLERGMALYDPQQHHALGALYGGQNPGVWCRTYLTFVLWLLGYPEQALRRSQEALALAEELALPFDRAAAQHNRARLHQHRRDVQATQEWNDATQAFAAEQGFVLQVTRGTAIQGWVLVQRGQVAEGIAQLRQGLHDQRAAGAENHRPHVLAWLAEAYRRVEDAEAGLCVLAEAFTLVTTTGGCVYEAELYRLKGELLLHQALPDAAQAEVSFQQALKVARHQQARSWELRAAMSLSRLWQQQGKRTEAHALLAPSYGWFTEGFDTADLQEAKALLEELGG
jgi:DNA-binding winged helix-turn-helix (wHTH) protein/predicted ATPase